MRFLIIICVLQIACAHTHMHDNTIAKYEAENSSCNYVMKTWPEECSREHYDDRIKGSIKSWSNSDRVTAADLNANFLHIHAQMVGGHGARLVDSDVSASAAIAASKLAPYRLIPRAWAHVDTSCTSTPCTITTSINVTSISRTAAGNYTVTLSYTPTNTAYFVDCNGQGGAAAALRMMGCAPSSTRSGATFQILATDNTATLADTAFNFVVYDND